MSAGFRGQQGHTTGNESQDAGDPDAHTIPGITVISGVVHKRDVRVLLQIPDFDDALNLWGTHEDLWRRSSDALILMAIMVCDAVFQR